MGIDLNFSSRKFVGFQLVSYKMNIVTKSLMRNNLQSKG